MSLNKKDKIEKVTRLRIRNEKNPTNSFREERRENRERWTKVEEILENISRDEMENHQNISYVHPTISIPIPTYRDGAPTACADTRER